ncbi:MAG: YhgN family NAAT transporter [Ferrimonas sp.]
METFSAAVMLFLIMDPLGNLPIFMSVLRNVDPKRRRMILIRELIIALVIMFLFLYTGEAILSFLNLRGESVSIAGGIILFLIAIKMIFPTPGGVMGHLDAQEPFIVPLAIPLIAGPSVLAALLLLSHSDPARMLDWSLSLFSAWLVSSVILLFSGACHRLLGERGLIAVERLMGMILVMLSVQMFLDGVANYLVNS